MIDNDPKHVEAAYQAAMHRSGKNLAEKVEKLERENRKLKEEVEELELQVENLKDEIG